MVKVPCFFIQLCSVVVVLLFGVSNCSYAQEPTTSDSLFVPTEKDNLAIERALRKKARRQRFLDKLPKNHNPRTATLLALIPGGGQIYNHRYWKLPIVWGGIGALGYFMVKSKFEFECHKRTYIEHVDGLPNTNYTCAISDTSLSDANLKIIRDQARSRSELLIVGFTLFYGLTVVDAFVDAHLMHFDIDDDLSLQLKPSLNYNPFTQQITTGIGFVVRPKPSTSLKLPIQFN